MMARQTPFDQTPDTSQSGRTRRTVLRVAGMALFLPVVTPAAARKDEDETPRIIRAFDPAEGELPESIAFDPRGNAYVTLGSGEIRQFSPSDLANGSAGEQFATIPSFAEGDLLVGITATPDRTLYTVQTAPTILLEENEIPESSGTIWQIDRDGTANQIVDLPLEPSEDAFPNDVVRRKQYDDLLVTDSLRGAIWQITDDGDASIWLADPLLDPNRDAPFPPIGVNGIAVAADGLYVANTTAASIVYIPVDADGTAGTPRLVVQDERLFGADGIALDTRGNIYVAVSVGERIVRVTPDGTITTLAEGEGLAFPSAVAFGTARGQQRTLYITNYDAVEALTGGTPEPSLAALDVGVPGRPIWNASE